jgi:competence ComEA-like helix-hairpin-helix protein
MPHRFLATTALGVVVIFTATLGIIAGSQVQMPDDEGRDLTVKLCGNECHTIEKVIAERKSKSQWAETMETMRTDGAEGTDDEFKVIVRYLATHYGVQVQINKATVRQIDDVLVLGEGHADAIVKYREANGPFADWASLLRVPGLDVKRMEFQKSKVVF